MRANLTELPGKERGGVGGLGQGRDRWARAGPGLERHRHAPGRRGGRLVVITLSRRRVKVQGVGS